MKDPFRHLQLTAFYEPAPEGGFTCGFEELPDVFSQGETVDEARGNLMDALQIVLEYHRDKAKKDIGTRPHIVRETYDLAPA